MLVPEWTAVENAVTKGICNALRGITVVPIEEVETLALSIVRDVKARYTVRSGQFLRFFRSAEIRKQLALMPKSWVFGQFDKGTTVLHGTCRGYFYSQFQKNIFQSPKRFHELERFVTPREGSQQLYALIAGTAHRFFIGTHLPQASVTSGLQAYVDDPQKPPWPTLPRIMRLSPDFKHIIRKLLGTAKLKLQGWARGHVPTAPGKRRRLVKHIRTLVRGLPIPGNTHPKTRGSPAQGHIPRTLVIYRDKPPRVPSKVELIPADVMHQCIVPYICNQKEAMTLFLLSSIMLDKGISMLGTLRIERLDKMWWKLYKIRACLGTGCEPIILDSSSDSEGSELEGRTAKRRRKEGPGFSMQDTNPAPCGGGHKRLQDDTEPSSPPAKRPCSVHSQKQALTLQPPCPLGTLTTDASTPLTSRFPAGHSFWMKQMDVPMVCIPIKWKSDECSLVPLMKAREVIMYHKHPLRRIAVLVGRCLTMLWREAIRVTGAKELFAMTDVLPFVRSVIKNEQSQREQDVDYWWVEYDLVEMFPNIPREEVLQALQWARDELKSRLTYRGGVRFYLSKSGRRKLDNMRVGARDSFWCFAFDDVMHYMTWDLNFNTCFLALSSVFTQVIGTAIGSSCSAQVASLVLIFRERTQTLPSVLENTLWSRYRDNFLVLLALPQGKDKEVQVHRIFEAFRQLTAMNVTVEQVGREIDFLECTLRNPLGSCPIAVRDLLSMQSKSTPCQVRKMLSALAPSTQGALVSMVPNAVKKSQHLRLTPEAVRSNLKNYSALYQAMEYPRAWWEPTFRKCCLKWGLLVGDEREVGQG